MMEIGSVLSGEGAKLSLSLIGILVGVCFGILSFLPKLIEDPYGPNAEVKPDIERRNQRFVVMIRRVRRTSLFLLTGGILLWLAALLEMGQWARRNVIVAVTGQAIAISGGLLVGIGLLLFLYSIVRYPVRDLTTWQTHG